MKFNEYIAFCMTDEAKRKGWRSSEWRDYYESAFTRLHGHDWKTDLATASRQVFGVKSVDFEAARLTMLLSHKAEYEWFNAMRPFYKVWPCIKDALIKVKLNAPSNQFQLKPRVVAIRFAEDSNTRHSFLVHAIDLTGNGYTDHLTILGSGDSAHADLLHLNLSDEASLENKLNETVAHGKGRCGAWDTRTKEDVRIALSTLLLADDPSIIEPDVLSKDEPMYRLSGDYKYVEKAHRRGKIGWHIGKEFEVTPHYRRPHLALRHTGKGKTIPRIVPVKGCIVHRKKAAKVPTGYITPGGIEVEVA